METIFVLTLIVALAVWDKWFTKKKPDRHQAPDLISNADRGNRPDRD